MNFQVKEPDELSARESNETFQHLVICMTSAGEIELFRGGS
jgi:hypothetical protein